MKVGYVGGLIGEHNGRAEISNCENIGAINSKGGFTGGLLGYYKGTNQLIMNNCKNKGDINIINDSSFAKCYIGGIVGYSDSYTEIKNSYNSRNINGNISYAGGVIGYASGSYVKITDCYNNGNIDGKEGLGGIIGNRSSNNGYYTQIERTFNTGNINASSYYSGGIVGGMGDGYFVDCYNTGNITGTEHTGGIVGAVRNGQGIQYCYNTGTITGRQYVGGIAGDYTNNSSYMSKCYNTGNVSGTRNVGGIIGYGKNVMNVYNTGNIIGHRYIGGITGSEESQVVYAYNSGSVTGIAGDSNSCIVSGIGGRYVVDCFNLGTISSDQEGALVSGITAVNYKFAMYENNCTVVYCYNVGRIVAPSGLASSHSVSVPTSVTSDYYLSGSAPCAFYSYDNTSNEYIPVGDVSERNESVSTESEIKEKINNLFKNFSDWNQAEEGVNNGYPTLKMTKN